MAGTQFIGILATNLLQMDEVFHHVFLLLVLDRNYKDNSI